MVKKLNEALMEIKQPQDLSRNNYLGNLIENRILDGFKNYKKGFGRNYYAHEIYNNLILLSKIGERHIAMRHLVKFEREIGSDKVKY